MKRRLKSILKALWRLGAPIHRPLVRRLDARQERLIAGALRGWLEPLPGGLARLEAAINHARCTSDAFAAEANLTLDSVVRELTRLQMRVEALEEMIERRDAPDRLSIVDGDERAAGRMLAG
jgi:hypothetical protein